MKESAVDKNEARQFRARPLYITEPVPVYYSSAQVQKRHSELFRWLQSEEGKRRDQVQVLDSQGRVIQTEPWLEQKQKVTEIDVPTWTVATKSDAEDPRLPAREMPFRRFRPPSLENVGYLADDDDEEWLKKSRMRLLSFERIMTSLEKLHFQQLKANLTTELKNGRLCLCVPPEEVVLSLEAAVESLGDSGRQEVERVHGYWIEKRKQYRKPLLPELWSCFPWSVLLDRSTRSRTANACQKRRESLEHPFEGSLAQVHIPATRIPLEEQLRRLLLIRQDLEVARTLADQVRKREKLKKKRDELLLTEIEQEISCSLSPEKRSELHVWLTTQETPYTGISPESRKLLSNSSGKEDGHWSPRRRETAAEKKQGTPKKRRKGVVKAKERFTASQRVLRSRSNVKNGHC